MKVAIDVSCLLDELTGVGVYTYNLIKSLQQLKENISLYYYFNDGNKINKSKINFKENILFPGKRRKYLFFKYEGIDNIFDFFLYQKKRKMIKDIDIFHCSNYEIPVFVKKRKFSFKKIITIYDMSFVLYPEFFAGDINNITKKRYASVKETDAIITISNSSKKDIVDNWEIAEENIKVIYPGLNDNFYQLKNKIQFFSEYQINYKYILYVGTLEPRKNLNNLIEAFNIIKGKHKNIKLILIGKKGWLYESIFNKIQELNLQENVLHFGYIPDDDLPYFYLNAELFAYPSIYEGFGLPPLEAMACGCPVITSNTSSLPEVVEDAAILVNPHSIEEIATEMDKILSDKKARKELKEKGLKQAQKFSWEKTAQETIKVYKEILTQ